MDIKSIVTDQDINALTSEITDLEMDLCNQHNFSEVNEEDLEMLVAKAMKLGMLHELKKWQMAQATPQHQTYFSRDFNGDGFKYHNTLDEAKKEALANLEWYQERVADGHHVNEDGNFNELCYGVVIESAGYNVEDIVTEKHHANDEYTQYEVGTEILSLGLYKAMIEAAEGK